MPRTGLILVNAASGTDEISPDDVAACFHEQQVERCDPSGLQGRVRAALNGSHPDFVGVAGGDGTVRAVADVLHATGVPLLVIPAGTRNHFARQCGIDTLDAARRAVDTGRQRRVDVAAVNGRCFVNNATIGIYPRIVARREMHERRLRRPLADVVAAYEQLRSAHRFHVKVEDEPFRAWMVFVGNGRYGERLLDLAAREALDSRVLDVRVVRAERRLARLRAVGATLLGQQARSAQIERFVRERVRLEFARAWVEVALDGEVESMRQPLQFECRPEALTVFSLAD